MADARVTLEGSRSRAWPFVAVLVVFAALRFGDLLRAPFLFDDYAILDKVRRHSLPELWAPRELLYGWYRPWSRETHFWVLERTFGVNATPFHVVSLVLWVACLAVFALLARRLAGERAAVIATCGFAAVGAWSAALLWAAGAQELWLVLFALLAFHAFLSRRDALATLAALGALLSKETACVVPVALVFAAWWLQGDRAATALRRAAPMLVLTAVWAALHPTLRARLVGQGGDAAPGFASPAPSVLARTLLSFVNVERVPRPDLGGWDALLWGIPALLAIAAVLIWNARHAEPASEPQGAQVRPTRAHVVAWSLGWAALAITPLLAPGIVWASYYALLAAGGVWLAVGTLLAVRPAVAAGLVVGVATLAPLQARTPAWEWGAPSFLARAAYFTSGLEHSLRAAHPSLAPHTRLWFADVPQGIGVGETWFDPVFRVWYRDTTLVAGRWSDYRMGAADAPPGADLFFRFAPPNGWDEVQLGPEAAALPHDPQWIDDHRRLAVQLGEAGDWPRAASELEKLAAAVPAEPEFAANLAFALRQSGEPERARAWEARAESLARATPR